ncbi:MAG: hypothetical protein J6T34_02090 [Bacilli bacterium]|nr:hypothetical protein [Bacilli bacterium]
MSNSAALTGLFANNLGKGLANRFASSGALQGLGLSEKLIVRQDIGKGKLGEIQGLSGAGGTLATLGVMGAIAALVAGIKVFQANTIDSKIGRANELKISAAA